MRRCEWCGKPIPESEWYQGGPYWNRRYYCSKKCVLEGENNLTKSDIAEDNLTFSQRTVRFVKRVLIIIVIAIAILLIISQLNL